MKTMVIDGKHYIQASPPINWRDLDDGACGACAFHRLNAECRMADSASVAAFGGDCDEMDVVYQEVQP